MVNKPDMMCGGRDTEEEGRRATGNRGELRDTDREDVLWDAQN